MSFWKFMAAPPPADSVSTVLQAISSPANAQNGDETGEASTMSSEDVALYEKTLDTLLATPDLLSEIKSGTNDKLIQFLATKPVVLRLGGWVVWGLGRERLEGIPNGGIVSDDIEDGKVPDFVVTLPSDSKKLGMGGVPRRRDMDEMGQLEGDEPETAQEKAWAVFPRLCTEILSTELPNLGAILFEDSLGAYEPPVRPSARDFLLPFWESLLGSTELQLETRAVQVGYWARVNGTLLNGPAGQDALRYILTIPHLLPRLLALLPFCSPVNDLLLLILRISSQPSPLIPAIVGQTIRMLDPFSASGIEGHVAAEELLRGMIELCSAVPSAGPPGSGGQELTLDWRDNTLARQIADRRSVRTVVDWMLMGVNDLRRESRLQQVADHDVDATPRMSTIELDVDNASKLAEMRTSSLIQSISVLVDLIRKNNSDFVEQQMLSWARRKEEEATEREMLEAEGAELVDGFENGRGSESDRGPSLIDLGAMLSIVAGRLSGLQQLVKSPRSRRNLVDTSAGALTPLTLERFRICEFYAELLHCSNMSLLNRPTTAPYLYDDEGHLAQGWRAANELADALAGPLQDDDESGENDETGASRDIRLPASPTIEPASRSSEPIDLQSHSPRSGLSTPSHQGSLDSESGILTKEEAKELRDLVAAAEAERQSEESDEHDGGDPFGDPPNAAAISDDELVQATRALELDDKLRTKRRPQMSQKSASVSSTHSARRELVNDRTPSPTSLPPGPLLKKSFMEERVIETMLQMFFDYPWNNFLHNVVFDILQQVFQGRIDRPLDRQLALSVFLEGRLIDRILEGQVANDEAVSKPNGTRLGYMGHMSLIAEEIVKLFDRYPEDIYAVVQPHIPESAWNSYVDTTLRETRQRDLVKLGGGVTVMHHDTASTASGISDEDDEFPMNSQRAMRAMEAGGQAGGGSPTVEGAFGGHGSGTIELGEGGSSDQFSRYLQSAISSDRPDKFGSSDEDDDDDDDVWGGETDGGAFGLSSKNSSAPGQSSQSFGFDDRFDSMGTQHFRSALAAEQDAEEDGGWGPFAADASSSSPGHDGFKPTIATSAFGFGSNFASSDSFGVGPGPVGDGEDDDDDFGDFENASAAGGSTASGPNTLTTPSITLPAMEDALEDFDFDEETRQSQSSLSVATSPRPSFARTVTADNDGSAPFGGLALDTSVVPVVAAVAAGQSHAPHPSSTTFGSPSLQADLATSDAEPLGPGMRHGSHLTRDGFVEAVSEVDGSTIRVPADDIVLAHRRNSSEGERPLDI